MSEINPISLHPDNPRYFMYNGRQTVLVGSCEHYGALLNAEYDYEKYLDELARRGLNHDRVFSGPYREVEGESFNIMGRIISAGIDSYRCPWPRSDRPGAADGGNLFDLDRWEERYFERLHDFMDKALARGIIVEFVLFCPFYHLYFGSTLWDISPLHPNNNINNTELAPAESVHSLKNPVLLAYMEKMTVRLVQELNQYPNLLIEVCNEPWNDSVPMDWHQHITDLIHRTEADMQYQHLVSMDVACGHLRLDKPLPGISVYNYHYVLGQTVEDNQGLGLPMGLNETGFWGQEDTTYRRQGWEFMLSGGALYNNLDYSFSIGFEDGTYQYWDKQPGGGSAQLRTQLGWMLAFLNEQPLTAMKPDRSKLRRLFANSPRIFMLSGEDSCCGYILSDTLSSVELLVAPGEYRVVSLDPFTGDRQEFIAQCSNGDPLSITLPQPSAEEMAFSVLRLK